MLTSFWLASFATTHVAAHVKSDTALTVLEAKSVFLVERRLDAMEDKMCVLEAKLDQLLVSDKTCVLEAKLDQLRVLFQERFFV